MQSCNWHFSSPAFRSVPTASQADKHGSGGRRRLTQDPTQITSRVQALVSPKHPGRGWLHHGAAAAGQPPPSACHSPNLVSEPCIHSSSLEELPLQRSSCTSNPALIGDKLEGNYSYGIDCHFNRLLITPLLLMSAIVMLRRIIVLSTVLTQGKVIPCTLIVFHKLWCIFL